MNSIILFKYEIKRIIWSKKYLYILLLIMASTYDFLTRLVVGGYMGTAPFSDWTYTLFLNLISPLLMVSMIFIISRVFSEREIRVRSIIYSTPISQIQYYMLKSSVVFVVSILTALVPIIMSFIYYRFMFGYEGFGGFIKLIIAFLLPTSIFFLGLSMVLGKINVKFVYALFPIAFLMGSLTLGSNIVPIWADIFGNNFFNMYSIMMLIGRKVESVPLELPISFIYSRLGFIMLGMVFLSYACRKKERQ